VFVRGRIWLVALWMGASCPALIAMAPTPPADASTKIGPPLAPMPVARDETAYAEPALAVSPTRPNLLVGGAIALDGGTPNIVSFRSTDAGASWAERSMAVNGFALGYDPSAAFYSPRGVVFAEVVVQPGSPCDQGGSVAVFSSRTAGASWSKPILVRDDRGTSVFADKPMIAADPSNGNVYLAWSQASTTTGANFCQSIPSSNQLLLSVSHDGGRSFGPPVEISARGFPTAFGAAMTETLRGKLFVAFEASRRFTSPVQAAIYVAASSDGGRTFTTPKRIGPAIEPAVPAGANLYPTSWPAITTSGDGTVTVAWSSGAGNTRISWASRPAATGRFSSPRTLQAPPGDDLMPALAPGPIIGYLSFHDGLEAPMVSIGGASGFRSPVRAARPGPAGSPDELGEYLGVADVSGRVAMLWPQVRDDQQLALFARTHLRSPSSANTSPSPSGSSPTATSTSPSGTGPRTRSGSPTASVGAGTNRWIFPIVSALVAGLVAAFVVRVWSRGQPRGRHRKS
jgi:hypothetical protein